MRKILGDDVDEDIYKGNKIIAEFMGVKYLNFGWIAIDGRKYAYNMKYYPHTLKYHSDWEWLMPVFIRLNNKVSNEGGCFISIHFNYVQSCDDDYLFEEFTPIKAVWKACIDLIKFFNSQNNQL
jgi:hypothetical protein